MATHANEPLGLGETDTVVSLACNLADTMGVNYTTALVIVAGMGK